MRRPLRLYALALGFVLVGVAANARAQDPIFATIDFPGATDTFAHDINTAGDMVGRYFDIDNKSHGWLRSKHGKFSPIDVPGANLTAAEGINSRGDIVGPYRLAVEPMKTRHGFLLKHGEFITIDVPDAAFTQPLAVNNRGDIVGRFCRKIIVPCSRSEPENDTHGFLKTAEGKFFTIDVPGADWTTAWKINPSGQIVGAYQSPDGERHVFQISKSDLMSDPDNPPFITIDLPDGLSPHTENGGINARGDIVGAYCDDGPCTFEAPNAAGFLLSGDEFKTILFPDASNTLASGINARGDIVGGYTDTQGTFHGFLLRKGKAPQGLP